MESDPAAPRICPACGVAGATKFCADCGILLEPGAAGARELLRDDTIDTLGLDRRILHTLRDLLLHPVRITSAYMSGARGRYLPPIRLALTVGGLYMLALSYVQPNAYSLERHLGLDSQRPETVRLYHKILDRGLTPVLANERYRSRLNAVLPVILALGQLSMIPILGRVDRRRSWHQHLMFSFGATNVICVWGLLLLPFTALGVTVYSVVVYLVTYGTLGMLFWKLYPGRSPLQTGLGCAALVVVRFVMGMILTVLTIVAVIISLLFF
jgi:Protein of unknown function (DUF3667)